jgi:hypothetical protein
LAQDFVNWRNIAITLKISPSRMSDTQKLANAVRKGRVSSYYRLTIPDSSPRNQTSRFNEVAGALHSCCTDCPKAFPFLSLAPKAT